MKWSVITVSYNSESTIERTIQSVLAQTGVEIEYIVIDGLSKDNTLNIISKYKDQISTVISEKDNGIYDAMNKGWQLATGDYVHFLNSDDWYSTSHTLKDIQDKISDKTVMYHGKLCFHNRDGSKSIMGGPTDVDHLIFNLVNFHQPATFFPLAMFQKYGGFDLSYKVAADYDLMYRFLKQKPSYFIDQLVTEMSDGGMSTTNLLVGINEVRHIALKNTTRKRYIWFRYWRSRFGGFLRYNYPKIFSFLLKLK